MSALPPASPRVLDHLTKDYAGFRQAMLDQIPTLLPEWDDPNDSDLGVVLVELFAYVADILSYYQDRIADEGYLATATSRRSVADLLALIGYRMDPGLSATTTLHLTVDRPLDLDPARPLGVATREGEVVFEVLGRHTLDPANNEVALTDSGGTVLPPGTATIPLAHDDHHLGLGQSVHLEERDGHRVTRSAPLTVTAVDGSRVTVAPHLDRAFAVAGTVLMGNDVPASHGRTVPDEPRRESDGSPRQRVTLLRAPVSHLLVPAPRPTVSSTPGGTRVEWRSRPAVEVTVLPPGETRGASWQVVDTLAWSGATDRHYVVHVDHDDRASIEFGDGRRGAIPPTASEIAVRYRVGLGAAGNVGPDRLVSVVTPQAGVAVTATNPWPATGGADHESVEDAKVSGPASLVAQDRAVTLEDHVRLASGFPGVAKAGARLALRGGYKVVQVFAAPEDPGAVPPASLGDDVRAALRRHLEDRMPLNRMAGVEVHDPTYVPVDVDVEVYVRPGADPGAVRDAVAERVRQVLGFAAQGVGRAVRPGELYAALYPLPGIVWVLVRGLSRGDHAPTATRDAGTVVADLVLAPDEMAYPRHVAVTTAGVP